tara:strand:+ start:359 stop:1078 length:720 start_codon:yes stop_codon:yes gene_type:complete
MAYYGDIDLKGQEISALKGLEEEIYKQKGRFTTGMGKKHSRETWRRYLSPFTANIGLDKVIAESDRKPAPKWMRKLAKFFGGNLETIDYGDPDELKDVGSVWAPGVAERHGEELQAMHDEADIPYWELFLQERQEELLLAMQLFSMLQGGTGAGFFDKGSSFTSNLRDVPTQSPNISEVSPTYDQWQAEQGGYIPKKYYGGGNVPRGNEIPSIAGYFDKQNKTLGGSDKRSLANMLGRR